MRRKVIQIADSTQLVSLPRKWAVAHDIKKGDELEVLADGDTLTITTDKGTRIEKAKLHFDDASKFLRRNIDVLYRYGFDEVEVTFNDPSIIDLVQDCLDELIGFEIIHQGPNSCTIRDVASGREVEFDSILRRLFFMITDMAKNSYGAIKDGAVERLGKLEHFDTLTNKITNLCERLLNKNGYKGQKKKTLIYYMVCQLEQVADEFRELCVYVKENKSYRISKEALSILNAAGELIDHFSKIFYEFNIEGLYQLKQRNVRIANDIRKRLESKAGSTDTFVLYHLNSINSQIQHMSTRIL